MDLEYPKSYFNLKPTKDYVYAIALINVLTLE